MRNIFDNRHISSYYNDIAGWESSVTYYDNANDIWRMHGIGLLHGARRVNKESYLFRKSSMYLEKDDYVFESLEDVLRSFIR